MTDNTHFDDDQYQIHEIEKYEVVYGRHFVSPGGKDTTAALLERIPLQSGMNVLDIGCGLGGAAFLMAQKYGVQVHGIDISGNMIQQARRRCAAQGLTEQITFFQGDCLKMTTPTRYDFVHSRDVFLHIADKQQLFLTIHEQLNPGGWLLFTDYCRAAGDLAPDFSAYIERWGYNLQTVSEYRTLLESAGFVDVLAQDETAEFIRIHHRELDNLVPGSLPPDEMADMRQGWQAKIVRAEQGQQRWGLFIARRAG